MDSWNAACRFVCLWASEQLDEAWIDSLQPCAHRTKRSYIPRITL